MAATPMQAEEAPIVLAEAPPVIPPPVHACASDDGSHEDDEELALLPRHTKVLVVGNNRTKAGLVGRAGVVKKAVGLGGWHWLRLENGDEVRLQRNALHVVEHPTGSEPDFSDADEDLQADHAQEQLPKVRARRPPRQQEHSPEAPQHRRLSGRTGAGGRGINWVKVSPATLKSYRRHYKLSNAGLGPNPSTAALANAVSKHWAAQELNEKEVLTMFIEACLRRGHPGQHA